MAEGRYCASEFFCPSIAKFFNTTVFEDDKLEEFFASITLKVLQHRATLPAHFLAPTSPTLCLPGPSNAHELQRLKDEPQQKHW